MKEIVDTDNIIEEILKLHLEWIIPDLQVEGKVSNNTDYLNAILAGMKTNRVNLLSKSLYVKTQEARLNELLEVLLKYTMMDFSQKIFISDKGDELDAIALGLNTLGEELESHIRQLEENDIEMQKKTQDLIRSNKQLEQFVYIASHDLQEPLRTLTNYVSLFRDENKDSSGKKPSVYLEHISKATARMQLLIKDLLDYARIGQNQEIIAINCEMLVSEVLVDLAASIQESNAEVVVETLPVIKGHYTELKSLFQNLISNAIKFRKNDAHLIIRITAQVRDGQYVFAISDNGIGIEKNYHERIFLIFQKLHSQRKYAGTGIGLAYCRKVVEEHKGEIWVESEPGKGSTFYFSIPKSNGK